MKLKVFTDGGARGNPGPAGIGVYVVDENNTILHEEKAFVGVKTNNVAEYMAFLSSLEWVFAFCNKTEVESIDFFLDSKLVVEQVKGNWKVKSPHLLHFVKEAQKVLSRLPCKTGIFHVARNKNKEADRLVNEAIDEKLKE